MTSTPAQSTTTTGTAGRFAGRMSAWRIVTVGGLVVSAAGIGVLWASGVVFPVYPPPGIVILTAGAVLVALAPWRWVPAVGAALGLFIAAGFANLSGQAGAGALIGTIIQLVGAIAAVVAGLRALRRSDPNQWGPA